MLKVVGFMMMMVVGTLKADEEFVPKIPEECLKQGYCEHVPGYPEEHAVKLVRALGDKKYEYLVNEEEDLAEPMENNPNEIPLCRSIRKNIIPKAAQDTHGRWYFLLNPMKNPLLKFRVEVCGQEEGPCDSVAVFPFGYIANCTQKYIERVAPVIDHQGALVNSNLKFPCDCYCKVISKNIMATATLL